MVSNSVHPPPSYLYKYGAPKSPRVLVAYPTNLCDNGVKPNTGSMDPRSRAAILNRWKLAVGNKPCPATWAEITITDQLTILSQDSQLASILQGQMDADTEIDILMGTLSPAPQGISAAEAVEAARREYLEDAEVRMAQSLEALQEANAARSRADDMGRQQSAQIANAALVAQSRSARGW